MEEQRALLDLITNIVQTEIRNLGLLKGQWHLGKVNEVKSDKMLSVFVDGSSQPQNIPCNPDGNFSVGSEVWVVFINGDSKNKFVISRRGI